MQGQMQHIINQLMGPQQMRLYAWIKLSNAFLGEISWLLWEIIIRRKPYGLTND